MKKFLVIIILAVLCYGAYFYNDIKSVLPTTKYETEIRQIKRIVQFNDYYSEEDYDYSLGENLVYVGIKGDSPVAKAINEDINKDIALCDIDPFNVYSVSEDPEDVKAENKTKKKYLEKIEKGLYKVDYKVVTKKDLQKQNEERDNGEGEMTDSFLFCEAPEVALFTDNLFVYNIQVVANGGGTLSTINDYNYLYSIDGEKITKIDTKKIFSDKKEMLNLLTDKINAQKKKDREEYLKECGKFEENSRVKVETDPITVKDLDEEYLKTFNVGPKGVTFKVVNYYDNVSSQFMENEFLFTWDEIIDFINNDAIKEYGQKRIKYKTILDVLKK